jgi:4-hydroxy-tetrahydrodipicolinate synthase
MTRRFTGSITAMITPFKNGRVNYDEFAKFINWQIEEGTHGFVPCGTTGESPTLNHKDHNEVIKFCITETKGRIPVIGGTGSNSTEEAIDMSREAEKNGADAVLVVVPYYNKPTQEGIYQHFKAVDAAIGIPMLVYNVPGRTVADINNETLVRLLELKNFKGIKDATGDLNRLKQFKSYIKDDFSYISGEDDLALDLNRLGACGTISVTSNIAPKLCAQVQNLSLAGKEKEAQAIQDRLMPLHAAMFCETSPGPVKYAAKLLGLCNGEMKLPLVEISAVNKKIVEKALTQLGLK